MKLSRMVAGTVAIVLTSTVAAEAQTDLTPYSANPVLTGTPGDWDAALVMMPQIVLDGGVHYLFYSGRSSSSSAGAIGVATSTDGVNFTKYAGNPVLTGDGTGFDEITVFGSQVLEQADGTWVMFYGGRNDLNFAPTHAIGRATAASLLGPWSRLDSPVLTVGPAGEWDSELIAVGPVIQEADGRFRMYYTGLTNWNLGPVGIGMATSDDGIVWQKHDDPATTSPPFQFSDPVLPWGEPGAWDDVRAGWPTITTDGTRWDLYYTGWAGGRSPQHLGYATSLDGVRWTRAENNPVLYAQSQQWSHGTILGSTARRSSGYRVYYSGTADAVSFEIGVASGPLTDDLFLGSPADSVPAAGLLQLDTWQGEMNDPAYLFLTAVNGSPFFLSLADGQFDSDGVWRFEAPNPGIGGVSLTFQTFAPGRVSGAGQGTNQLTVILE